MILLRTVLTYILMAGAMAAWAVCAQAVLVLMWEQRYIWRIPLPEFARSEELAFQIDRARQAMARFVVALRLHEQLLHPIVLALVANVDWAATCR